MTSVAGGWRTAAARRGAELSIDTRGAANRGRVPRAGGGGARAADRRRRPVTRTRRARRGPRLSSGPAATRSSSFHAYPTAVPTAAPRGPAATAPISRPAITPTPPVSRVRTRSTGAPSTLTRSMAAKVGSRITSASGHDADERRRLGPRVAEELGSPTVGEQNEAGPVDGGRRPPAPAPICAARRYGASRVRPQAGEVGEDERPHAGEQVGQRAHAHDGHAQGAELLQRHERAEQQERALPHPVGHEEVGEEPTGPGPLLRPPAADARPGGARAAGEGQAPPRRPRRPATQARIRRVGVASPAARTAADTATWTTEPDGIDRRPLWSTRPAPYAT